MLRYALILPLLLLAAPPAQSDTYPARPVRLVAPFPAGGTADAIARTVANEVSAGLGQSFVIDNRSGANGIIGTDIVAKAPPDGHTLLHVTGSFVINPSIYRKLPFDIFRDFAPVTNVVLGTGYLMLVNPSVPAASVKELIALAKTKKLTYSSPGVGNTLHLAAELFNVRSGVKLTHVPYKGVAPAMNAVVAGEVDLTFMPPTVVVPLVRAGRVKALAFTGAERWPVMPELPTMTEAGVANLALTGSWHGWFAPAGTPPAAIARLQREVQRALQVPKVKEFIVSGGYEPDGRSTEAFRRFVRDEFERYAEMVRIAGVPRQ